MDSFSGLNQFSGDLYEHTSVGISLDSDSSALKKVIADKKFTWPMSFEGKGWDGATPHAWGVTGIPQTFIIGPDGTVLWRGHPAQIDETLAAAFRDHPPVIVDPKVAVQAKTTLDQIDSDLAAAQTAKAAKLLGGFPTAAKADPDIAARLMATTTKVQDAASLELAAVDPMIQAEQYAPAIKKLRELSQTYAGLPVAASATSRLKELASNPKIQKQIAAEKAEKDAADALANAKQLKADKKDELAYSRFSAIARSYPDTAAGTEAAAAVKTYEADAVFMQKLSFKSNQKKAESLLSMADNYRSAGNADQAKAKYQEVVQQFPGTAWADTADTAEKAIAGLAN